MIKTITTGEALSAAQQPHMQQEESNQPTTIAGYALAIAKALDHYGVDSRRVLHAAGIPAALSNDPMVRLPVSTMTRLFRMCVEVTNDPYFGLTAGRFIHISNLHAVGHALAASATLLDFCRRLERYFRVASQTSVPTLTIGHEEVILHLKVVSAVSGETQDAFTTFLVLAMRQLYRSTFNPLRIGFAHPQPKDGTGPYDKVFRAPVAFDQVELSLVFARSELEQPLAGACAELAQINDQVATQYLARLDRSDVLAQVRQKIIELLPSGECSRDKVAESLHLSPTTLQLKLTKRNTSFHDVLDETRRELACAYMQQAARSITEIAFTLGFTDTSNFARAFKRWTGASPTEYRQKPSA